MKMRAMPTAAIVDMDGTLANVSSIRHMVDGINTPKDFHAFHRASEFVPANRQAIQFCKRHHKAGNLILVVTARMRMWEDATTSFLEREAAHHFPWVTPIWMRRDGDTRSDREIKEEIFEEISQSYRVVAACDDNPSIVSLWEEKQIPEIEVVPGWDYDAAAKYASAANRARKQ